MCVCVYINIYVQITAKFFLTHICFNLKVCKIFLKAKVESDKDLANALKYEELVTKYNKIQKEIVDIKRNNYKMKTDLNEKTERKKNIIKNIDLKQNIIYLVKHKTENYSKFIEILNEKSNVSNHFSTEANDDLTKTDYEVSNMTIYYCKILYSFY